MYTNSSQNGTRRLRRKGTAMNHKPPASPLPRFSFIVSIVFPASDSAVCPSPTPSLASAPNTPPSTRKTSTKPTLLPPSSETPRNSALLSLLTAPSANSINSKPGTKSTPAAPPSWPTPATCSSAPSPPSSTNSIPNSKTNPRSSSTSLAPSATERIKPCPLPTSVISIACVGAHFSAPSPWHSHSCLP